MALIVVLIALAVQRFLNFHSAAYQLDWASHYFQWMNSRVKQITAGHGLVGLAILVLPIVFVAAIIFTLAYGLLGYVGTGILQLILVWYCLDVRDLRKEPYGDGESETLLLQSYQRIFAVLFWYCLFGPVGLVLYVSVNQLSHVIPKTVSAAEGEEEIQSSDSLHAFLLKAQGVLDWAPVRLLGLSFALVGSFGAVFKLWMQKLFHGITDPQALVVEWGRAALKAESSEDSQTEATVDLVDRSLLVWLVVVFLVTIGVFLG